MTSDRKKEERLLRKKRIVNAALAVFNRLGIDKTTIDEIAIEAGFGKATLYYYFSSKNLRLLNENAELTDLKREARLQKIQVEHFAKQVRNFETEMSRLAQFERKLRVIAALESATKLQDDNWAVGGPYGLTTHSFTTSLGSETTALVDRLSQDLGQLGKQVKYRGASLGATPHKHEC
mgnify:CR=1 FL=1